MINFPSFLHIGWAPILTPSTPHLLVQGSQVPLFQGASSAFKGPEYLSARTSCKNPLLSLLTGSSSALFSFFICQKGLCLGIFFILELSAVEVWRPVLLTRLVKSLLKVGTK